jgi:uncharacterized protein YecT (DUF1311 family)
MNMKNKMRNSALISGVLLMSTLLSVAHADDQNSTDDQNIGLRPSYQQCLDDSGGVTSKLLNCNGEEIKYQDRRLNDAYKTLTQSLAPKDLALLRAEERKWITYRDSYCAPDPNSGPATDVDSSGCKVEQTAKRASVLEARLHK